MQLQNLIIIPHPSFLLYPFTLTPHFTPNIHPISLVPESYCLILFPYWKNLHKDYIHISEYTLKWNYSFICNHIITTNLWLSILSIQHHVAVYIYKMSMFHPPLFYFFNSFFLLFFYDQTYIFMFSQRIDFPMSSYTLCHIFLTLIIYCSQYHLSTLCQINICQLFLGVLKVVLASSFGIPTSHLEFLHLGIYISQIPRIPLSWNSNDDGLPYSRHWI